MHYRAISNTVSHLEVFCCERINTAKQKDGLTSFFMLANMANVRCAKIAVIDRQRREMNSRLWRLNQKFYLPRKTYSELHCKLLVALAIVSVAILSPGMAFRILCLC